MSLLDKLKKNSTIKETSLLKDSKFFNEKDVVKLSVPLMNVAFSGSLDGGMFPGITQFAGPSRHFKTGFALVCIADYLNKYPEAVCLFYDTEFGSPQSYFERNGIDPGRVLHTPIMNLEELKHDMSVQLSEISRGDKIIVVVDSVGNVPSKKEVEDAVDGKSVADMTRAKQLKSLFRIVTPHVASKDFPLIVINHTYQEIGLFPKTVVGGGTGSLYSSDNIFILGRRQEKTGAEVTGYQFILNVEKSRYVREKSAIPVEVTFEGGINKYGGLLELARESGHVLVPSQGWYQRAGTDQKLRAKDLGPEFWEEILQDESFKKFVEKKYRLVN